MLGHCQRLDADRSTCRCSRNFNSRRSDRARSSRFNFRNYFLSQVDLESDQSDANATEPSESNTYTTVESWLAAQAEDAIEITNVRLNPTETGVEVVLETAAGQLAQPTTTIEGNTFIADIANAVLTLPEGQTFRADNPIGGITEV
ncbi:MAG: AMIN domain-containing protein [Leptolyngbyaceae cyanobacterium SM1_3_5]|nr:AMIN domain-containing protein [Leptolyngbyaceae cyanobacterium SM1_3_5]